jgi:hypothetical protein
MTMPEVLVYSLGASSNPDRVCCEVPWRVDDDHIFFGPCKKRIREHLRKRFLGPDRSHTKVTADLFLVGVNRGNKEKNRKVVWAGKLSEVMTFAEAHSHLKGDRFHKLRNHRKSPLHVRSLEEGGKLIGYEHISELHKDGEWVADLVSKSEQSKCLHKDPKLTLKRGKNPWQVFDRDCCMLLENLFFALGQGIEFDEEALEILRQVPSLRKQEIDHYAIFGRTTQDRANGLRGRYLRITGDLATRFVAWLGDRSRKVTWDQKKGNNGPTKTRCH